ncbi:hypothetical protein LV457_17970 [Mycobacterium sp. MYCO198283]|uniref:hypothetical protein n=1 Tax=Mycobacterium sp. MYCO198283 TaxID=2883505 RepID=UPI001E338192|nr:hypothetical protein [Mycobacterium sp. MYCO198283]MCG5434161.1 hypothetical protein [Mycobacterium sp. MYCO198283]
MAPRRIASLAVTAAALAATAGAGAPVAAADEPEHLVRYTVTTRDVTKSDIWYPSAEPNNFTEWSAADGFPYMTNVYVVTGPDQPWSIDTRLRNPGRWAMVAVNNGTRPHAVDAGMHCEIEVDGVVVVSKDGEQGVLCALRNW